eukprot:8626383-Lingulodinium_polyedra.AAC.1
MPDIHFGLWQAGETSFAKPELTALSEQLLFFRDEKAAAGAEEQQEGPPTKKRKTTRKGKKGSGRPVPRATSHSMFRAVDHLLQMSLGQGLSSFGPLAPPAPGLSLDSVPVLVLHTDEHSVNLAMVNWLSYHMRIPLLHCRDIFHREWNDAQDGIKSAGLWHVVALTSLVYNLNYGPWEGGSWFEKLRAGAQDLFATAQASDPLFNAFHRLLCWDKG